MKGCLAYNQSAVLPMAVCVPVSKSIAARLGVIAFLAGGEADSLFAASQSQDVGSQPLDVGSRPWDVGARPLCEDLLVMRAALRSLAVWRSAKAVHRKHAPLVNGRTAAPVEIDLRDSGTARHLLTALCACTPGLKAVLRVSPALAARPFSVLPKMLSLLCSAGIKVGQDGCITISGGQFSGLDLTFNLDTSRSSQPCSALMLVAPYGRYTTCFALSSATASAPYIDMTARLMQACGAAVKYDKRASTVSVKPAPYRAPSPSLLEGDWSAAAFFYLHALLSGREVVLRGLCAPADSLQGDAAAAGIFEKLGVRTLPAADGALRLCPGFESVRKLDLMMRSTPDLVPAVAAACAMRGIPFVLCGISHLRHKECDRLQALKEALGCFGIKVGIGADSLEYDGLTAPHAPAVPLPVCADHRMAMALAQTAVLWPGIELDDTECVKKSFPDFWEQMERLGVRRT